MKPIKQDMQISIRKEINNMRAARLYHTFYNGSTEYKEKYTTMPLRFPDSEELLRYLSYFLQQEISRVSQGDTFTVEIKLTEERK